MSVFYLVSTRFLQKIMTDHILNAIEEKVDALAKHCAELESDAANFREKEAAWEQERLRLIEKNEKARTRVEAMITHLKNLSANSEKAAS